MPGSLTSGIPDYHDPNEDLNTLLGSRKRSDREKGKELVQMMEQKQNRDIHEREFNERALDRRSTEQDRRSNEKERESQAKNRQDQLDLYRQQLSEGRTNRAEDVRSAHLNTILNDPNTKPEIRSAIENHLLKAAGVSATIQADPKAAALARSKGLPEPQPTVLGGTSEPTTTAPAINSDPNRSVPRGAFAGDLAPGSDNQYPVLPNTPEPRFVPLGHGSLEGSRVVEGGIQTPSGGFIGGKITPGLEKLIAPRSNESRPEFGATQPDTFGGHDAGSSFGENAGIDHLVNRPSTQQPTAAAPTEPNVAGEAFKRTNQDLGKIGQSLEPFTAAKNAVGSLFGGGQGGANDIVKQPTPQATPPAPQATPAPGTQFQGPLTATAGFLSSPNAPAPQPALTPPAIPPTKKPTPEEERQRMALQQ